MGGEFELWRENVRWQVVIYQSHGGRMVWGRRVLCDCLRTRLVL